LIARAVYTPLLPMAFAFPVKAVKIAASKLVLFLSESTVAKGILHKL